MKKFICLALSLILSTPTHAGVDTQTNTSTIVIKELSPGTNKITINPPVFSTDYSLKWPSVAPTNGQYLSSNASGDLSFVTPISSVTSVFGRTGAVVAASGDYSKGDVGLLNVDNVSDLNKPISTLTQTALNLKANLASPTFTGTPLAPTQASTDNSTAIATTAYVKAQGSGSGAVSSVFGRTGAVVAVSGDYSKGDVGLLNVDNVSDINKPVSTAQQTALNLKANLASPTFTGTPLAPTQASSDNSTALSTTAFVKSLGYLSSAPVTSVFGRTGAITAASGDYSKADVGLALAENTSDLNKVISTATQTALNLKANLASPTFTGSPLAPTSASTDNSTAIATTAFVNSAAFLKANNFSDVISKGTARANLNIDALTTFSNADYTVTTTDKHIVQTGTLSATRTVTLPLLSTFVATGKEIIVGDESGTASLTNMINIVPTAPDTFSDGSSLVTIRSAGGYRTFISDKTNGKWVFDQGQLRVANNLSDVQSASTARTNLGLGTLATQSGTFSGTHSGTSSGTNTGDQTITLTGDATGSGTGSFATSISASTVTGKALTGFTSGAGTVSSSDTILQGINKLDGNIAGKQATLVSGTNIKTLNGSSVLGSGDLTVAASASGSTGQVQYNSGGNLAGATALAIETGGNALSTAIAYNASVPSTPASGKATIFTQKKGSRAYLSTVDDLGTVVSLAAHPGIKKIRTSLPTASGLATLQSQGFDTATATGTATLRSLVTNTTLFDGSSHVSYVSTAAIQSGAGVRWSSSSTKQYVFRGSAAPLGGFFLIMRAGVNVGASTMNWAMGLYSSTGGFNATQDPSVFLNLILLGADAADTNLSIMSNDGSGTATKVSLGANFPAKTNATDIYELRLYCPPGGTSVYYYVERLNTGDKAEGVISSDLPVNTTAIAPILGGSTMTGTAAIDLAFFQLYLETDY